MKKRYNSPGVYIEEIRSLPKSIAQVETAIPAFVGYTQLADRASTSLLNIPTRVRSILEFEAFFGKAFPSRFQLSPATASDPNAINQDGQARTLTLLPNQQGFLYSSVKAFFSNGGRECFIVSVGIFAGMTALEISKDALLRGLAALNTEPSPSILAIPDAVLVGDDAFEIYQAMLVEASRNFRFAILDVPEGFIPISPGSDCISDFRNRIGSRNLSHGAAYYPWLVSPLGTSNNFDILSHISSAMLQELLPEAHAQTFLNSSPSPTGDYLHQGLRSLSPTYLRVIRIIQDKLDLLPPSGFIAGIFAQMDTQRGVWKAPANVSLNLVRAVSVPISSVMQEGMNSHPSGKSINAIRAFPGKGFLVWGARTLEANDMEWRYIPTRRMAQMIEKSIQIGLNYVVFEANTQNTWVVVKANCTNFLTNIWQTGGLAGARPADAFFVKVGLGETMTSQDLLEKRLIVELGIATLRPSEFIILRIVKMLA